MRRLLAAIALSAALATPVLACGAGTQGPAGQPEPPLAARLDDALRSAKLPDAALAQVEALRAEIARLAAADDVRQAREVEGAAMNILGYRKTWLRCGPGSFQWTKPAPKAS